MNGHEIADAIRQMQWGIGTERYVLSLCDRTGRMVRPWIAAGYHAVTVDLQPAPVEERGRTHLVMDVRDFSLPPDEPPLFVAAFPPCTHLASSGARWWREKGLRAFIDALDLVDACKSICERSGAPWMLENPIGRLSTSWRPSDHVFHPCHYSGYAPDPEADAYTKKTCLWVGGASSCLTASQASRHSAASCIACRRLPTGRTSAV